MIVAAFSAFTLIMFAMRVNIERRPHGLFFRFGRDSLILIMFVATLVSGIAVCFSSTLVHDAAHLAGSISLAFWGTNTIITLVIQAYERTLFLINPAKQLNTLLKFVERDLKAWGRRAEKAKPLLKGVNKDKEDESDFMPTHDIKKSVICSLIRTENRLLEMR